MKTSHYVDVKVHEKELTHNLKTRYEDFKKFSNNNDEEALIFTKGLCRALEQIAVVFGDFTLEQIAEIKRPIIGSIDMNITAKEDLDIPPHIRKNIDINSKISKK